MHPSKRRPEGNVLIAELIPTHQVAHVTNEIAINISNISKGDAAGPKRKQLKVRDPLKFNWRPKELLPQLANIYLHLERADSKGVFAHAIAVSDRYRADMFPETCQVCSVPFPSLAWLTVE